MAIRLLLCDDEEDACDLVLSVLEILTETYGDRHIAVTWARTVEESIEQIQAGGWDMIVSDVAFSHQPGAGADAQMVSAGIGLVGVARERRGAGTRPPIVVLTQYATDQGVYQQAIGAGADAVVSKGKRRGLLAQILAERLGFVSKKGATASPAQTSRFVLALLRHARELLWKEADHVCLPRPV